MALGRQAIHALQVLEEHHRKAAVNFRAYREAFETLARRVQENAEPSLRLPDYSLAKLGRQHLLDYHLRHTTFVGRQAEMEQLWQFVNSQPDEPCLWWMVTGPGGMGKSRLAFEFCREMRGLSYHVGFLEKSDLNGGFIHGWSHWRPSRPTVLVVDYVAGYAKDVLTMLGELSRSAAAGHLPNRVRVLLLERETRDDWWGSFETDADVAISRYGTNALPLLDLPRFDRDRLWGIIEEVYGKESGGKAITADKEQTLDKLMELDTDGRPLFAFLVALALATHNDIRTWNVDQLLDNLLRRYEEKIWSQFEDYSHIGPVHKNLLMLATLGRGIEDDKLDQLYAHAPDGSLPTPAINDGLYNRMAHITKNEEAQISYDGLQPDLVGEYFVLRRLTEILQQRPHGKKLAEKLLEAVWVVKPENVKWMYEMAVEDFYPLFEQTAIPLLTQTTPPIGLSATHQFYWTQLHYNLAHPSSRIFNKEPHYKVLKVETGSPKDLSIASIQAMGAFNLATYYGGNGNFVKAEIKYQHLQELVSQFKNYLAIALIQAKSAVTLINFYGKAKLDFSF